MVILLVAVLTAKILSPSALLTRAAIAWIRPGRRQAATIPAGRGVLRPRLQRLHPLATPPVVMMCLPALERTSPSSHRSSGHAGDLVELEAAASSSPAARVELEKKLVEQEKKLVDSANKSSFT